MSSYLSQAYEPNKQRVDENFPLLFKVMEMTQGKYDANKKQIQDTLDAFGAMQALRPEDNEYISAKLSDITTQINSLGEVNLAKSSHADTLLSKIKATARDPFIVSAMQNTAKFRQFQAGVEEIKKKDINLYDQSNYTDALELAGFDKYMSGESDEIGNLQYNPYTNVNKVLNEEVAKYAKDAGLEKYIDQQSGEYYFKNVKGERVRKGDIINFIQGRLDPSLKTQLQINARQTYKNLGDNEFNQIIKGKYEQEVVQYERMNAELLAEKEKASETDRKLYENKIKENQSVIDSRKEEINRGTFDRNLQYGLYQNDLFNTIASVYGKDNIVDIDYNTIPLQIKQYESDLAYKAQTLNLKEIELGLKMGTGQGGIGTALASDAVDDKEKPPVEVEAIKNFNNSWGDLKASFQAENPTIDEKNNTKFNDLSPEGQAEYLKTLSSGTAKIDLKNSGLSENLRTSVARHSSDKKVYMEWKTEVVGTLDKEFSRVYTDMFEGLKNPSARGLNVKNLALTMPKTAEALQNKKDFNSLNETEKNVVRAEMAANMIEYGGGGLSSKEKANLKMYVDNAKNRKAVKADKTANAYVSGLSTEQRGSFIGGMAGVIKDVVIAGGQATVGNFINQLSDWAVGALFGEDAYRKEFADSRAKEQEAYNNLGQSWQGYQKAFRDVLGATDSNITELEPFDVVSGTDVRASVKDALSNATAKSEALLNKSLEKVEDAKGYSFATANKAEKPFAELLEKTVLNTKIGGSQVPIKDNVYNLQQLTPDQYRITYKTDIKTEKGVQKQNSSVVVEARQLPAEVLNTYRGNKENWSYSNKNPKATPPAFTYVAPKSPKEAIETIKKVQENHPSMFVSQQDLMNNLDAFADTLSETEVIKQKYGAEIYNRNAPQTLAILNSEFEIIPEVLVGQGFILTAKMNGEYVNLPRNQFFLQGNFNEDAFKRISLAAVKHIKNKKLKEIYGN